MALLPKPVLSQPEMPRPVIMGVPGTQLDEETIAVLKDVRPAGFILFKRNVEDAAQLAALCTALRAYSPFQPPLIFIDQEGGRVARIRWGEVLPPAAQFGAAYDVNPEEALTWARLGGFITAVQLRQYGITVNCTPVADVRGEGMHDAIGDRAYHHDPNVVAALCGAVISGHLAGGVWPVIKHVPGHGRAESDSHFVCPDVPCDASTLETCDFIPFAKNKHTPFVMTAHIRYPALDAENPASHSEKILQDVVRRHLGMEGILVSDDINMAALEGGLVARANACLEAGCDYVLQCSGKLEDMRQMAALPVVREEVLTRTQNLPSRGQPDSELVQEALQEYMALKRRYGADEGGVRHDPTAYGR